MLRMKLEGIVLKVFVPKFCHIYIYIYIIKTKEKKKGVLGGDIF